jgi:hypothetical protein
MLAIYFLALSLLSVGAANGLELVPDEPPQSVKPPKSASEAGTNLDVVRTVIQGLLGNFQNERSRPETLLQFVEEVSKKHSTALREDISLLSKQVAKLPGYGPIIASAAASGLAFVCAAVLLVMVILYREAILKAMATLAARGEADRKILASIEQNWKVLSQLGQGVARFPEDVRTTLDATLGPLLSDNEIVKSGLRLVQEGLGRLEERVSELKPADFGPLTAQITTWADKLGQELQELRERLNEIASQAPAQPPSATALVSEAPSPDNQLITQVKRLGRYYESLVDDAVKGRTRAPLDATLDRHTAALRSMISHFDVFYKNCSGAGKRLTKDYFLEIKPFLPKSIDGQRLKDEIKKLCANQLGGATLDARRAADLQRLAIANGESLEAFKADRVDMCFDSHEVISHLEAEIRALIVEAFAAAQASPPAPASDAVQAMRAKISDLIGAVEDEVAPGDPRYPAVNKAIEGVLDCLGFELLDVQPLRDEFKEGLHTRVEYDEKSTYPANTITKVLQRGFRDKADGSVRATAKVIVAGKAPQYKSR